MIFKKPAVIKDKTVPTWDKHITGFFRTFGGAILIALVFRSLLFEPFHIPSGSMKDNLLVGDYLFVSKYAYGYSRYSFPFGQPAFEGRVAQLQKPERGDVVVFRLPRNTRIDYIKRIIGMPGDTLQVRGGTLYINGAPLPREQLGTFDDDEDPRHIVAIPRYRETLPGGKEISILKKKPGELPAEFGFDPNNTPVYEVPQGHYFMMGDNRDNSRDSRFLNEVGFVPEANIVGRAEIIFFSTDGQAAWWQVWAWLPTLRFDRFFKAIH